MASISELYFEIFDDKTVKSKKTMKDELMDFYQDKAREEIDKAFELERSVYKKAVKNAKKDPGYAKDEISMKALCARSFALEQELVAIDKEMDKVRARQQSHLKQTVSMKEPVRESIPIPRQVEEKIALVKALYKRERDED